MKPDALDDLKAEMMRLRSEEARIEMALNNRFTHFKTNYRSMLWSAINPLRNKESISSLIYNTGKKLILPAVTHESSEAIGKMSDQEIAAMLIMKLFNRLGRKRKKKKPNKPEKL